jgi:hypothetical protein
MISRRVMRKKMIRRRMMRRRMIRRRMMKRRSQRHIRRVLIGQTKKRLKKHQRLSVTKQIKR